MKIGRRTLALSIIFIWAALCVIALWWFQIQHIAPFYEHFVEFNGQILRNTVISNRENRPIVVHFLDPKCPCTGIARAHIAELEATFSKTVAFYAWPDLPAQLKTLSETAAVPATPSVAIWSETGELAYFGPYSSGVFCGQGDDFVSAALRKLEEQENPGWINHDALGCYCPLNREH